MLQTKLIMGMPITIEILGCEDFNLLDEVFNFFKQIDNRFSTYKKNSEISRINRGEIKPEDYSPQMKHILALGEQTKQETMGYFDYVDPVKQQIDPSGIVKGWAISEAAKMLDRQKIYNYYIEAGGDIQVKGKNINKKKWRIGIKNPFNSKEVVKVVVVNKEGVATSGLYERGQHIYNPKTGRQVNDIVSLTVIGPDIYEADRFATAAFAMGKAGIYFIDQVAGLEGYQIDQTGVAIQSRGFNKYELH